MANWIKYWRNSLADAESINVDIAKLDPQYKPETLTPCFVSTFHMLPKMMQYSKFHPTETTEYLSDFMDLLIVDESGQVSPEVGIPFFYLAKKAMVVGDNYQIEPVWNVDARIDEGNLIRNHLIRKNESKRAEFLKKSGYMSSNGNLMKLAQKSCGFEKELKESKNPENVKPKPIHELVGIVTPFAAQKGKIKNALNLYGYQPGQFQYGTVHSMQGAEKDIILFSPVYTSKVTSGYFFDKYGPNMLNVAVSRAKRSFIIAGDFDVFKRENKKIPSNLLAWHINDEVDFNLSGINI